MHIPTLGSPAAFETTYAPTVRVARRPIARRARTAARAMPRAGSPVQPVLAKPRVLGRSGLQVSPWCLGTMNFGQQGWGCNDAAADRLMAHYLESGGNFIDAANIYSGGASETIIGKFMREGSHRDRVVLSSKFSGPMDFSHPNGSGNSRKHVYDALEASLRRLQTDYLDIYWLHRWDQRTPAEEIMSTLDTLVASGKVRYLGVSNAPAWFVAHAQTLALERHRAPFIASQYPYSLLDRGVEAEHLPVAATLGMGLVPYSPLANGLLTGKYTPDNLGSGRMAVFSDPKHAFSSLTKNQHCKSETWSAVEKVRGIAERIGATPAQVSLNWLSHRPGVASVLIGANTIDQLTSNMASLEFTLPQDDRLELDSLKVAS